MATTTIKWNLTAQTYVHTILGDDFNGTGTKDKPFQSLYRGVVKGGTIAVIGPISEMIPSLNDGIAIYADSFGAAWFDGKRLTGRGGAVSNGSNVAGDDEEGYHIYYKYIYNMIYLRSCVPVGVVGVGYSSGGNYGSYYVGGGSLLVDSFTTYATGSGHHCAFIYPKLNANANSKEQNFGTNNASYCYGNGQTFVGVWTWKRGANQTKNCCVFDECEMPVIFNNASVVTFDHCVFRNVKFTIPATLSVDGEAHQLTSDEIADYVAIHTDVSCSQYITEWINQYKSTSASYAANIFDTCLMIADDAPLFNNLNCVWRDATTGEIVSKENSSNAYIDPELSTFDISINQNSPAVPYLSDYETDWRGTPALDYKMDTADDLTVDESATGDIQLSGNLKFDTDSITGKRFITWNKPFDDPTLTDDFKGGIITTRPRQIPSSQLFKYPKIAGRWSNCLMGEKNRNSELTGRNIHLTGTTVAFDDGEAVALDGDRLWLKDTPASNEITAGYRYIVKEGSVLLYNSTSMVWIEYTTGAVITTAAGNTYFLKRLYDEQHTEETVELLEVLPNNGTEYDAANRLEVRLFNSQAQANLYNTDPDKLESMWIPILLITDQIVGIHYYDLPQNDIIFSETKGYMISQNPNISESTMTLAVHQQDPSIRYDSYNGDDVAGKDQGVYIKTATKNRAKYGFSPLNDTLIFVQLRLKAIPFLYTVENNNNQEE